MINSIFPALEFIDGLLRVANLGALVRIVFWGAASGVLAILVYLWLSNQRKIIDQKLLVRESRTALASADDAEPGEVFSLAFDNLKESLKLLGLVFVPSLLSAIPVILVIFWLSSTYSYAVSTDIDTVELAFVPENTVLRISADNSAVRTNDEGLFIIGLRRDAEVEIWSGNVLQYSGNIGNPPVDVVHKKRWWNFLIENPAGYLEADSYLEKITIQRDRLRVIQAVPGWMGTWEFSYFVSLFFAALALKFALRVE